MIICNTWQSVARILTDINNNLYSQHDIIGRRQYKNCNFHSILMPVCGTFCVESIWFEQVKHFWTHCQSFERIACLKGFFNGPQSTYCGWKGFISNTGRPLQMFPNEGTSDKYLQNSFCGSYRLTTYCEGLTAAASDLSKLRTWATWVHVGGSSNLKEGFAMLFVNTLFNLDEIHFNMSNTLTNFRVNIFQ